jgi:hypothetical protein
LYHINFNKSSFYFFQLQEARDDQKDVKEEHEQESDGQSQEPAHQSSLSTAQLTQLNELLLAKGFPLPNGGLAALSSGLFLLNSSILTT